MIDLAQHEKYTFPVIEKVVNFLKRSPYLFVAGDSTAVRSYCAFKRDFEDLDLIFHPNTNTYELEEFIQKKIPECRKHENKIIKNSNSVNVHFTRMLVPLEITYGAANYFIVDFHIGGSIYKQEVYEIDDNFFYNYTWRDIRDVGESLKISLPVPSFEELFLFKLGKFLGKDKHDLISLLTNKDIRFKYLKKRFELLGSKKYLKNISEFEIILVDLVKQWETYHFCKLNKKENEVIASNLHKLKKMINAFK